MSDENKLDQLRADLEVLERYQSKHDMMAGMAILNLKKEIARLEAEQADPWREAKEFCDDYRGDKERFGIVTAYIDHLTAERDRLAARVEELEAEIRAEDEADVEDAQAALANEKRGTIETVQIVIGAILAIPLAILFAPFVLFPLAVWCVIRFAESVEPVVVRWFPSLKKRKRGGE